MKNIAGYHGPGLAFWFGNMTEGERLSEAISLLNNIISSPTVVSTMSDKVCKRENICMREQECMYVRARMHARASENACMQEGERTTAQTAPHNLACTAIMK